MDETRTAKSVNLTEFLDESSWTLGQKMVLALAAIAFALDGCANQILGVAMPDIIRQWGVPREAFAPVAAASLFGVAIGAALGGMLADRIGRRWGLISAMTLFATMTILASTVDSILSLAIVRFFDGIGIGAAIPSGAALLTECCPRRRKAIAIAVGMVFLPAGGLLSGLLGAAILPDFGWRALFAFVGSVGLAAALLLVFVLPESPLYLVQRPERKAELLRVLRRFKGEIDPTIRFFDREPDEADKRWSVLLGQNYRRETLGIWFGFFCCLLATYSVFSWLPTLLSGQGFDLSQSSFIMSAFNGGAMCGGLIAGFVMQRFGERMPLILMAAAASIVAAALSGLPLDPENFIVMTLVFGSLGLLLAGMHTGFYTLAALVYPAELRASGIGSTAAFGRLGAIASSFTGVLSMELQGSSAYFLFIALVLALSVWSISYLRPPNARPVPAVH